MKAKPDQELCQAIDIGADRMMERLVRLGRVGSTESEGRTRLALSGDDAAARSLIIGWMREAGLQVEEDAIGNVYGRMGEGSYGQALMLGSHIDTVGNAGALDGCYGVIAAIEVADALRRRGKSLSRPLVVAVFSNEEGVRFQPDLMGSRVVSGQLALDTALQSVDDLGVTVAAALKAIGCEGAGEPRSFVPAQYLELHIEQGPVLETIKCPLGVVTSVYGAYWFSVQIYGMANHAGTTPMSLRRDAFVAASQFAVAVNELAVSGGVAVATVGQCVVEPGLINIIPRSVRLTVDLRDSSLTTLDAAESRIANFAVDIAARQRVTILLKPISRMPPVQFDDALTTRLCSYLDRTGYRRHLLPSGATHDAQAMATVCPSAMLFVPSAGGVSHNPAEHTDIVDLKRGLDALFGFSVDLLDDPILA